MKLDFMCNSILLPQHCASVQPPKDLMHLPYNVDTVSDKSCSKNLTKIKFCI